MPRPLRVLPKSKGKDLTLLVTHSDGVMPIALTRTYRPGDTVGRAFGLGTSHPYDMYIVGNRYTDVDLIMAHGGGFHFTRISSGTGPFDAVFEHTSSQSIWYKARISWVDFNPDGVWKLQ
jgi:hypothetical protein